MDELDLLAALVAFRIHEVLEDEAKRLGVSKCSLCPALEFCDLEEANEYRQEQAEGDTDEVPEPFQDLTNINFDV